VLSDGQARYGTKLERLATSRLPATDRDIRRPVRAASRPALVATYTPDGMPSAELTSAKQHAQLHGGESRHRLRLHLMEIESEFERERPCRRANWYLPAQANVEPRP